MCVWEQCVCECIVWDVGRSYFSSLVLINPSVYMLYIFVISLVYWSNTLFDHLITIKISCMVGTSQM